MHPVEYLRQVSERHFPVLVLTAALPTDAVLTRALEPFGPRVLGQTAKWRWWALGGRFTGGLICYDFGDETLVGGLKVPPEEACIGKLLMPAVAPDREIEMLSIDQDVRRPGRVDACRGDNLIETMVEVDIVVDDNGWFEGDSGGGGSQVIFEPPNVWHMAKRERRDVSRKWLAIVDCCR
jgi:hypothetical protein